MRRRFKCTCHVLGTHIIHCRPHVYNMRNAIVTNCALRCYDSSLDRTAALRAHQPPCQATLRPHSSGHVTSLCIQSSHDTSPPPAVATSPTPSLRLTMTSTKCTPQGDPTIHPQSECIGPRPAHACPKLTSERHRKRTPSNTIF